MSASIVRLDREALTVFCQRVFESLELSPPDAKTAALVLVAADAKGIPSHGTGRLARYVNGLKTGQMLPRAPFEILADTPSSLVIDAHGGMGAPVSARAMGMTIEKAKAGGMAFACVRDSNHFGIASYWASMALDI